MRTEYVESDLVDIANKKKTIDEIAYKYNVSVSSVKKAMSRRGLRNSNYPVLARYNGKEVVFHSANHCANIVGVARQTVVRAIKGNKTILKELGIEVEYYYGRSQEE